MDERDRNPALADAAPDQGNEPAELDDDFAAYCATQAMWSQTWRH